jgi:putative endonuclease
LTKKTPQERLWEHNAGIFKGYTSSRLPVEMLFAETFESINQAIERERQIKGWSRKKKEGLIAYQNESLPELASRPRRDRPV